MWKTCEHFPHTWYLDIVSCGFFNEWMTRTQRAVVAWHFASWTAAIIRDPTDATEIFFRVLVYIAFTFLPNIPAPLSDRIPSLHGDFH
jgi:hypothetical protein